MNQTTDTPVQQGRPGRSQELSVLSRHPFKIASGVILVVLGLLAFPLVGITVVVVGNNSGDPRVLLFFCIPVAMIVVGLLLMRWGKQYAATFVVTAPPEKVVEKVLLWGSGTPLTTAAGVETTVVFTRRRHPPWSLVGGAAWLGMFMPVGIEVFPVGLLIFALGGLFFLVKTTQTLTVSATPIEGGSTVTIRGEAVDPLIRQLERLMSTSPVGSGSSTGTRNPDPRSS